VQYRAAMASHTFLGGLGWLVIRESGIFGTAEELIRLVVGCPFGPHNPRLFVRHGLVSEIHRRRMPDHTGMSASGQTSAVADTMPWNSCFNNS